MANDASLRKLIFLPEKWSISVSSSGVFICLGKLILSARTPITGNLVNVITPRFEIHDKFSTISSGSYCGLSNGTCIFM